MEWAIYNMLLLLNEKDQREDISIIRQKIDIISPNFVYALISTISKFGLLHIIFGEFVIELWP